MLLQKLKIDDPVDAVPVHGFCGIWGLLATALFDWGKEQSSARGVREWGDWGDWGGGEVGGWGASKYVGLKLN